MIFAGLGRDPLINNTTYMGAGEFFSYKNNIFRPSHFISKTQWQNPRIIDNIIKLRKIRSGGEKHPQCAMLENIDHTFLGTDIKDPLIDLLKQRKIFTIDQPGVAICPNFITFNGIDENNIKDITDVLVNYQNSTNCIYSINLIEIFSNVNPVIIIGMHGISDIAKYNKKFVIVKSLIEYFAMLLIASSLLITSYDAYLQRGVSSAFFSLMYAMYSIAGICFGNYLGQQAYNAVSGVCSIVQNTAHVAFRYAKNLLFWNESSAKEPVSLQNSRQGLRLEQELNPCQV